MRILMLSNTYAPHVGGVARSVERFADVLRARGHAVKIVAPATDAPDGSHSDSTDVIRVPALQRFNGSDFSVRLPLPGLLAGPVRDFAPEVLHTHHPFLLGDTAARLAADFNLPLVFTHHTLYERYTHYVGTKAPAMKRFAAQLSTEFANLCDHAIAPSESVARLMRRRGVKTAIQVVPTGIDAARFAEAATAEARRTLRTKLGVPEKALVLGHIGRLAVEKNLGFLAKSLAAYLAQGRASKRDSSRVPRPEPHVILAGQGPMEPRLRRIFEQAGIADRVHWLGVLQGEALVAAYAAMDLFVFASRTETQGMVLAEAMAAGTPVLAVDASGVREIVRDGVNGMLLPKPDINAFVYALNRFAKLNDAQRRGYREGALLTAKTFDLADMAARLEAVYGVVVAAKKSESGSLSRARETGAWQSLLRRLQTEWKLLVAKATAAGNAMAPS